MHRGVVGHRKACSAGGLCDVGGRELVHRRFCLRNMDVRTGSGAMTTDDRRQRGYRCDPGRNVIGEDRGGVIEAAPRGILGSP